MPDNNNGQDRRSLWDKLFGTEEKPQKKEPEGKQGTKPDSGDDSQNKKNDLVSTENQPKRYDGEGSSPEEEPENRLTEAQKRLQKVLKEAEEAAHKEIRNRAIKNPFLYTAAYRVAKEINRHSRKNPVSTAMLAYTLLARQNIFVAMTLTAVANVVERHPDKVREAAKQAAKAIVKTGDHLGSGASNAARAGKGYADDRLDNIAERFKRKSKPRYDDDEENDNVVMDGEYEEITPDDDNDNDNEEANRNSQEKPNGNSHDLNNDTNSKSHHQGPGNNRPGGPKP